MAAATVRGGELAGWPVLPRAIGAASVPYTGLLLAGLGLAAIAILLMIIMWCRR